MTSKEIVLNKIKEYKEAIECFELKPKTILNENNIDCFRKKIKEQEQILQDLEILKILKDKVFLYIYENEPNQLYIAENKEHVNDKEKQLLKEWVNRE